MNAKDLLLKFGDIDEKYIEEAAPVEAEGGNKRKAGWIRILPVAAAIAVVAGALGWQELGQLSSGEGADISSGIEVESGKLIYVNQQAYVLDEEGTENFDESEIGDFVGWVSLDGENTTQIKAYKYQSEGGSVQGGSVMHGRIVVQQHGKHEVYRMN